MYFILLIKSDAKFSNIYENKYFFIIVFLLNYV